MAPEYPKVCPYPTKDVTGNKWECQLRPGEEFKPGELPCQPGEVPRCAQVVSGQYMQDPLRPIHGFPAEGTMDQGGDVGTDTTTLYEVNRE